MTMLLAPAPAGAIPAFARKYGLRCTACHEAWPKLNDFGRAFRDNGYQILTGKDDTVTATPGYWPVSIRITPTTSSTRSPTSRPTRASRNLRTGGVGRRRHRPADRGHALPERVLPGRADRICAGRGRHPGVGLGPVRQLFGSSWRTSRSAGTRWTCRSRPTAPGTSRDTGYLIYSFHASGSISAFDMGNNQRGIEYMGHDRGSLNRVVRLGLQRPGLPRESKASGAPPASTCTRRTNGCSTDGRGLGGQGRRLRLLHDLADDVLHERRGADPGHRRKPRAVERSSAAKGQIWFGPPATPFHRDPRLRARRGQPGPDSRRDAETESSTGVTWSSAGRWMLKNIVLRRYDLCKNSQQGVVDAAEEPQRRGRDTRSAGGTRSASRNRSEYALHVEYSSLRTRGAGAERPRHPDQPYLVGIDFAY